jgi:molybdate transport system regulatory protein
MKISARNVLAGTVQNVTKGAVNSEITLNLQGGEKMIAIITNDSVDRLGLKNGAPAFAVVKASDVMIGKNVDGAKLSARNVLAGELANVREGAVNNEAEIKLPGGTIVVASITKAGVNALNLRAGDKVSAIIKASHVLVGVS